MKTKYAIVGLGGRSYMYVDAITKTYAEYAQLVGVCDRNPGRAALVKTHAPADSVAGLKEYTDDQFDQMIAETNPDVVIVTTMDRYHEKYIVRAMQLGKDVITEKPMTTDEVMCQRIVDTVESTGRKLRVTFNYRYSPPRTQVKDLLMSGVIGDIYSIDFHWLLDTSHGADYFRRWHRNKENSGGLMVHKATHHFDLINFWIGSFPKSVFASGQRRYYVPETAERLGLHNRGERCRGCAEASHCPFYLDMAKYDSMRQLYLEQEQYDGYFRDRCVFSPLIDIEDNMNLIVNYDSGVKMSYSLNAFMPWEGYIVSFNGSKGRLEHRTMESVYINGDDRVQGETIGEATSIRVYPHFGAHYDIPVWSAEGGHGGGDDVMLKDIFDPNTTTDPYKRAADWRGGAYSILTGIAANHSMRTNQLIVIDDLVKGLKNPYID